MPPFRETVGFVTVPLPCGIVLMFAPAAAPLRLTLTVTVLLLLPVGVVDGYVVTGNGGSVKSSKIENLANGNAIANGRSDHTFISAFMIKVLLACHVPVLIVFNQSIDGRIH